MYRHENHLLHALLQKEVKLFGGTQGCLRYSIPQHKRQYIGIYPVSLFFNPFL